jgi:hypothetical protein
MPFIPRIYLESNEEHHYFILGNNKLFSSNSSITESSTTELGKSVGNIAFSFSDTGTVGIVTITHDSKRNQLSLDRQTIVSNSSFSSESITAFDIEEGDLLLAKQASVSNDRTKTALLFTVATKSLRFKTAYVCVFDKAGELLWQQQVSREIIASYFDMVVNNNGIVYMLKQKAVKQKVKFTVVKFNADDDISESDIEDVAVENIKATKTQILSNGNIFIGGYNAIQQAGINILGCFSVIIDAKTLEKKSENFGNFSKLMQKGIAETKMYDPKKYKITIKAVCETTNGIITMVAEESRVEEIRSSNTLAGVIYTFRNVFANSFSTNGEFNNASILYKTQICKCLTRMPEYQSPVSVEVLNTKDKLFLIYNENSKADITKNEPSSTKYSVSLSAKKTQTLTCEVKNGIIDKKKVLINAPLEGRHFVNIAMQNSNEALVYTQTNAIRTGKIMLEKITW